MQRWWPAPLPWTQQTLSMSIMVARSALSQTAMMALTDGGKGAKGDQAAAGSEGGHIQQGLPQGVVDLEVASPLARGQSGWAFGVRWDCVAVGRCLSFGARNPPRIICKNAPIESFANTSLYC